MVDDYTEETLQAFMAARIKIAMDECPLNGEAFAEAVGVSKAAASKWSKSGKISHIRLFKLAHVTDKPLAWFYPGFEEGDEEPSMEAMLESQLGNSEFLEAALFKVLSARRNSSSSE